MPIVADHYELIVGVDTHAASHTFAVVASATTAIVDTAAFPANQPGMVRALAWITRRCADRPVLLVVEGTGSYGAILTDHLLTAGLPVVEAASMPASSRRGVGKSDDLDAVRIARAAAGLRIDELRWPRAEGPRVALRVLVGARELMNNERTRHTNALTALIRTASLGVDARKPLTTSQITTIASWRSRDEAPALAVCRREATRMAKRIKDLDDELADNRRRLDALTVQEAPELIALPGVGPIVAAQVLIAWSHPGRVRSEAAFASLAGTCPIPASSGNTVRHRLNRGGDRQLNKALYTIAMYRMGHHPATQAYVTRRTAEGRTTKEIIRILKRYIARQLFRTLTAAHPVRAAIEPRAA
jgi:transposase